MTAFTVESGGAASGVASVPLEHRAERGVQLGPLLGDAGVPTFGAQRFVDAPRLDAKVANPALTAATFLDGSHS